MRRLYALFVMALSPFVAASALAWDPWPCEVVLCMANPDGPTAAPACRPPIERLWREMARPRFRMPTCQGQSYPNMDQMMRDIQRVVTVNPNPTAEDIQRGMTQAPVLNNIPANVARVQMAYSPFDPCEGGRTQVITYGDDTMGRGGGGPVSSECRGPQIGWTYQDDDSGRGVMRVPVYEGYQQQYYVGVAFDVYISGALWQRVRPGVTVSGEAGVTYVGTATGGSMQPRFEPPPPPSGGSLPFSPWRSSGQCEHNTR